MSKSRLFSGKIKKLSGGQLSADRYDYLDISQAEPDLGLPAVDNSVLIGDLDGSRTWTDITEYAEQFKGYTGSKGQGFIIAKTYSSVAALTADTEPSGIAPGEFAIIDTDDVEDPENSKLYLWTGTSYNFVTDLSGEQGIKGETGYTGSKGDIGFTGSQGAVGFTGSAGTDGVIGADGTDGATGFTGSQGEIGFTGSQGDLGFTGSAGTGGAAGTDGSNGYTGSQGFTGSQGESSFTWGTTPPSNPEVGDRWYDTNKSKLVVYVDDGDSFQWVEVAASGFLGQTGYTGSIGFSGSGGATTLSALTDVDVSSAVAGQVLGYTGSNWVPTGGGTTTYTNLNELPGDNNTTGSFAYISSTKQLYIWDGSMWDRVYTGTEQVPDVLTEPAASVAIIFSSSTTVQHTVPFSASDPEGFPITYDYAYNEPTTGMIQSVNYNSGNYTLTLDAADSSKLGQTVVFRVAASDGLHSVSRTQRITFAANNPISLSGGTNTSAVYTAPNGTVVTSSDGSYDLSSYKLSHLFDGIATGAIPTYWLSASAATGNLTFNFTNSTVTYLGTIQIFPRSRDDTFTSIVSVQISEDGINWTTLPNTSISVTSSTAYGSSQTFTLNTTNTYVRINLSKSGNWGLSMAEVAFTGFSN
jgi:hypothetical protein